MKAIIYSVLTIVLLGSCTSVENHENNIGNKQKSSDKEIIKKKQIPDTVGSTQKKDSLTNKTPRLKSAKKMERKPTKEKLDTDKLVRKYIRKGLMYLQNEKYELAIESFEMVIKLRPSDAKAFYHVGICKYKLKDYYGSLEALSTSSGLNPQDTVSLIYAGLSKFYLKDYYGAIRYYNKAIKENPKYEYAYFNRGTSKVKVEDYQGAITDFNRAIELKPDYYEAYNNRGNAYYYLKQIELACADWKKAKELGATGTDEILGKLCK